jgi:hypothetical protein
MLKKAKPIRPRGMSMNGLSEMKVRVRPGQFRYELGRELQ